MFPGDYSVCKASAQKDSDGMNYATIKYGYDSVEEALAAISDLAQAEGVPEQDLCVVRSWSQQDQEE